jgi:two-component system sensor histidine kinase TctE
MQRGVRGVHADRLGQGAGLGLAIVAKFAQVMGATFELARAPGDQGLQARVTFRGLPTPGSV